MMEHIKLELTLSVFVYIENHFVRLRWHGAGPRAGEPRDALSKAKNIALLKLSTQWAMDEVGRSHNIHQLQALLP
jgi:hypothetical protein